MGQAVGEAGGQVGSCRGHLGYGAKRPPQCGGVLALASYVRAAAGRARTRACGIRVHATLSMLTGMLWGLQQQGMHMKGPIPVRTAAQKNIRAAQRLPGPIPSHSHPAILPATACWGHTSSYPLPQPAPCTTRALPAPHLCATQASPVCHSGLTCVPLRPHLCATQASSPV